MQSPSIQNSSIIESCQKPFIFSQFLRCSVLEARKKLPKRYARQYNCLPLGIHQGATSEYLSILTASQPSEEFLQQLQFICGLPVVVSIGPSEVLQQAIEVLYAKDECVSSLEQSTLDTDTDESLSQFAKLAILHAITIRSSDIHIESEAVRARMRFRIRGELIELNEFRLSPKRCEQLCRHLKVIAKLDSSARVAPQEGIFELSQVDLNVRLRMSTVPTARGEKIVLRLLQNGCLEEIAFESFSRKLTYLGLFPEQQQIVNRFMRAERGALLVSGPTGSGKSTLLYILLSNLCSEQTNVVTIEDPVEAQIKDACQIDISNLDCGFEQMLTRVLRQDPDSLLVGEIRTKAAAHTTLQAAIAGTKVLSTVHAGSCFEVIVRLLELGISDTLLGLAVHTVSAQRLLPRNCTNCLRREKIDPRIQLLFQLEDNSILSSSSGCDRCHEAGRVAVYEFLVLSDKLKSILRESRGDKLKEFAEQAYREGYRSYGYYVRELLLQQVLSPEVACRALGV